jgi:hypothetical protein
MPAIQTCPKSDTSIGQKANGFTSKEIMFEFLFILSIAFSAMCISLFLQFLYELHPIGEWYYKNVVDWLQWKWVNQKGFEPKFDRVNRIEDTRWKWLAEPLGACIYCQNTWVFFLLAYFFDICTYEKWVLWVLIGSGLNYAMLEMWLSVRQYMSK